MNHGDHDSGWRHWGWMLLCCLPMIALLVLVALAALGLR